VDPATLSLRDIHLPQAVSWWPPAPGWWVLLALAAVALLAIAWWRRRFRARRANRAALRLLDEAAARAEAQPLVAVQTVSVALRRFLMTTEGCGAAAVTDEAWLSLLDSRWDQDAFQAGEGKLLARAPYMPPERIAPESALRLVELARGWLSAQPAARA
jgi:hypothetical protein